MIQTVKYQANIETPTTYTGYLVNGTMNVPLDPENGHYQMVQAWINEGNTPEPAYTQEELDEYEQSKITRQLENQKIVLHNQPKHIPSGWQICDGTKGTPDLQGVFIQDALGNEIPYIMYTG